MPGFDTVHSRSLIGAPSPRAPRARAHSRFRGSAVIPFDQAAAAQIDEMLALAAEHGVEPPRPFALDAIQLFYRAAPERASEVEEVRLAGWGAGGAAWAAPGQRPLLAWRGDEPALLPADRGRRHFSAVALAGEPSMLALAWDVTGLDRRATDDAPVLVPTPSSALYVAVRARLARGVPTAGHPVPLETRRWSGTLHLAPSDAPAGTSDKTSDLDADVLDAVLALWLQRARGEDDALEVEIDDILRLRGLQPKRNAAGHGAGFHPTQRRRVAEALERLLALRLSRTDAPTADEPTADAPVLVAEERRPRDSADSAPAAVVVRPGTPLLPLLGRGRQVAQMARQILAYDPYRRGVEKRLGRYLAWQWRIRARDAAYLRPLRVDTLLRAADLDPATRRPSTVRERFESALDQLVDDAVLAGWQYERWSEAAVGRRRWLARWREALVVLEPPPDIPDAYRSLERRRRRGPRPAPSGLGRRLAARRRRDDLTQAVVAERLGISRAHVAALESGRRRPSPALAERLDAWLTAPSS